MIQQTDLKRFRELLDMTHRKNGNDFKTDEIRIEKGLISIWNSDLNEWNYLTKNLEWVDNSEHEDIFSF